MKRSRPAPSAETWDLRAHGPNGLPREFAGDLALSTGSGRTWPEVGVECELAAGRLRLRVRNDGSASCG